MSGLLVTPVILCGGSGARLWPLSRTGFPKQFLCLFGDRSLFQEAVRRLTHLASPDIEVQAPLVVTGEDHRFLVTEQLREVGIEPSHVLLEMAGRNTAPALTLAVLAAKEGGDDPVLVVMPADHTLTDTEAFVRAMHQAIRRAADGAIVILGVIPTRPETGYGYIKAAGAAVEQFVEKPDAATAQGYLDEGDYYWNAGIFVLRVSVWLAALDRFRPDILAATRAAWAARSKDQHFVRPGKAEFLDTPSESIDCAVMERCPGSDLRVEMVPLDAGWSDLGVWDAVWRVLPKDADGNAHRGDVLVTDCRKTLVHASSRLVSVLGLDDVVVVETPDAVMVTSRARSQDVKYLVNALNDQQREERALHRKVHRPWGWYDIIEEGRRFKVKRILVKPGASLSLQKHQHRAEHWVVVSGTAEVTNGHQVLRLTENQSTYIPQGEMHRLANIGTTSLEIIEVQSGSYLGEDDICRIADDFGRAS